MEVTLKEYPSQQAELLAGDGQLLVHRQGGKPIVDAVKISNEEKKEDKGKNSDL